ncbi:hypothetical protein ACLX1H_006761 [Fusarium chlamydosporum]
MADDSTPLASLSVTHVYYDPEDHLSLACAYLALLPQALCVVYATLVLFTREVEVALMFLGQLACEVLNFALKRLIKEERPRRIHGKGYGMPSSHAQFVAFWSVSLALFLLVRHQPPRVLKGRADSSVHRPWSVLERVAVSVAGAAIAAATAWSRVYLNYHTPKQVLVGCAAGAVSAIGWFIIVAVLRQTGWLGWALETPLARAFRVRDLVVEEDMCQAGWEKWEERRVASRRTKNK